MEIYIQNWMTLASAGLRGGARGTAPVAKGSTAFASTAARASRGAMTPVGERPGRDESRDARGKVARASCAGAGCVRDGGDDEVGATGTMAPRGRRARDDTKRTELPRGQFSFPSAVHRTARSENLGRRRVRFSRKSKGDSGVSPTALFRKLGGKNP